MLPVLYEPRVDAVWRQSRKHVVDAVALVEELVGGQALRDLDVVPVTTDRLHLDQLALVQVAKHDKGPSLLNEIPLRLRND